MIIYDVNFYNFDGKKKPLKFLKVDVSLLLCGARTFMEFCHVSTFRQRERKLKKGRFLKQIDCWLSFFCFMLPFLYASIHQPACRSAQSCPVYTKCFASKIEKRLGGFFFCDKTNIFDCVRTAVFMLCFGHHHFKAEAEILFNQLRSDFSRENIVGMLGDFVKREFLWCWDFCWDLKIVKTLITVLLKD